MVLTLRGITALIKLYCSYQMFSCFVRRKLYFTSSEDDEPLPLPQSPLLFFNDDLELPIYSQVTNGYGLHEIVNILLSESLPKEKICKIQPLGVNCNSTLLLTLISLKWKI